MSERQNERENGIFRSLSDNITNLKAAHNSIYPSFGAEQMAVTRRAIAQTTHIQVQNYKNSVKSLTYIPVHQSHKAYCA